MNLLSKEPGSPEEKRAWVEREFPLLVLLAEREYPNDEDRQRAEILSRVIRHYRQQHRNGSRVDLGRLSPAQGRVERGKEAAKRVIEELLRR